MKKKRYLMIACLLFSPSFFINVEASERGSSSVGIEFYKKVSPKEEPSPKTDAPSPKGQVSEQTRTNQAGVAGGQGTITTGDKQLPRTGSKSQANLSILGLVLIGLVGMVHRKKGRHEAK
ncbi:MULTISPECIES: LPXTG cell wall anchor domain-containing protein [Enterococcus]|uniref:LPXTG cell wall anchor domain-containing protein n=1 Tax=Enterococcus TaxID=1350 RepID=UPI000F80AC84|nr:MULTISPECIES: LPXTG cell wall anchor domain-containing protein [Enterococcus]EGO6569492.1 LPXTG cell wall anchor domain-containing protein [Enterococcus faecalis]EGO6688418.1 LPXTG cell wall anchor domain-containing protein [Enterococcus faecalis]EGO7694297.1 LPXTG cell wall anchor domain-containing protein [Enterococcus faecalis]EGO7755676.1 LPXTG cell wall anchor domain-containing protein [Enterococcus faecalis]EGO7934788.1 LPXTG cell wall anchor domain-containing protein [Enterococcus fa